MYDYMIIGSGVVGAFIAKELSQYDVKVLVVDKESDIANGTTAANSAIIHSGYDPVPGTLKAKLNVIGNRMYPEICKYYNVPFDNIGSITIACDDQGLDMLKELEQRSKINGVEVQMLSREETLAKEPNITKDVKGSLFAPSTGIVYPWQISFALMDHAISNGVELKLNEQVISIKKNEICYKIKTINNEYKAKNIINCAGVYGSKIQGMIEEVKIDVSPRKGEYFVLSRAAHPYVNHVVFPLPTDRGKGILVVPISEREILVGPTSEYVDDYDDLSTSKENLDYITSEINKTVANVPMHRIMRSFSGIRATPESHDFIIEESCNNAGFFNVIGIESPGFASAPAIAKYVALIGNFESLPIKNNFKEYQPTTRISHLKVEELAGLVSYNQDYGRIICRCENVSVQEVVESIRGNIGATTIKGVKKRVRPGSGPCQGGFCEPEIVKIIAKEMGSDVMDVCYDKQGSEILVMESKGGAK